MPPSSRTVPRSDSWLSVMPAMVSFRSWNTRWLSWSSDSPAAVMRMRRPTRRKTGSFSSSSSSRICRLMADWETCKFVAGGGEGACLGNGANDLELAKVHEYAPCATSLYLWERWIQG